MAGEAQGLDLGPLDQDYTCLGTAARSRNLMVVDLLCSSLFMRRGRNCWRVQRDVLRVEVGDRRSLDASKPILSSRWWRLMGCLSHLRMPVTEQLCFRPDQKKVMMQGVGSCRQLSICHRRLRLRTSLRRRRLEAWSGFFRLTEFLSDGNVCKLCQVPIFG